MLGSASASASCGSAIAGVDDVVPDAASTTAAHASVTSCVSSTASSVVAELDAARALLDAEELVEVRRATSRPMSSPGAMLITVSW